MWSKADAVGGLQFLTGFLLVEDVPLFDVDALPFLKLALHAVTFYQTMMKNNGQCVPK
jgi:hypothetical protein